MLCAFSPHSLHAVLDVIVHKEVHDRLQITDNIWKLWRPKRSFSGGIPASRIFSRRFSG